MKVSVDPITIINESLVEKLRSGEYSGEWWDSRDLQKTIYVVRIFPDEENGESFYDYVAYEDCFTATLVAKAIIKGDIIPPCLFK